VHDALRVVKVACTAVQITNVYDDFAEKEKGRRRTIRLVTGISLATGIEIPCRGSKNLKRYIRYYSFYWCWKLLWSRGTYWNFKNSLHRGMYWYWKNSLYRCGYVKRTTWVERTAWVREIGKNVVEEGLG
jgi:hypothetical protein